MTNACTLSHSCQSDTCPHKGEHEDCIYCRGISRCGGVCEPVNGERVGFMEWVKSIFRR
jgi:hypothetical protein